LIGYLEPNRSKSSRAHRQQQRRRNRAKDALIAELEAQKRLLEIKIQGSKPRTPSFVRGSL